MKNFFLNGFGLKKDKRKKESEANDAADNAAPHEASSSKSKEKDSKRKRSSNHAAPTGAAGNGVASALSETTTNGKGKSGDDGGAAGASKKKSSSLSSSSNAGASVQPLPPPPPPPAQGSSPAMPPNPTQLALQHTALDDSDDDSVQHAADIFPAEQTEVSITQITEVFQVFQPFVDNCASAAVKQSSLTKLRKILPAIAAVDTTVTAETIEEQGFHPSFAIAPMLNHLLAQPAPLRARLCIAIYRFCGEMLEEVEDELLSTETGLFSGLQAFNPNLNPAAGGNALESLTATSFGSGANMMALPRCPNLDLAKIYHNLLNKEDYLPTAEELNEICLRVQDLLQVEPNVLMVGMPAVLVGDLHGQIRDLLENVLPRGGPLVPPRVLAAAVANSPSKKAKAARTNAAAAETAAAAKAKVKSSSTSAKSASSTDASAAESADASVNYLFLGDYVDRGSSSLRIIAVLFTAKVLSPNTVFLLRGNHECANTNRFYGFLDECHRRYPIVNNKVTSLQPCTLSPSEEEAEDRDGSGGTSGSKTTTSATEPTAQEPVNHVNDAPAEASSPDDLGWDMKDHPLWLVANDAFKMLPLCAALYEEVVEEVVEPDTAACSDAARESSAAAEKPVTKKAKKAPSNETSTNASMTSDVASTKSPKAGGKKGNGNGSGSSSAASKTQTPNASFRKAKRTRWVVRICAMHGGLSPFVDDSFDGIIAINRFRAIERGALADLTWSDPASESARPDSSDGGAGGRAAAAKKISTPSGSPVIDNAVDDANAASSVPNSKQVPLSTFKAPCVFRGAAGGFTGNPRGTGHIFGEDITIDFINTNHLYFVVRAHQCVHEGFQWTHHDRLLTIFSAPNYCGMRNKGAILLVDAKGAPSLQQYEYNDENDNPLTFTTSAPQPPKMFS